MPGARLKLAAARAGLVEAAQPYCQFAPCAGHLALGCEERRAQLRHL
jgi:hypothetical protein